MDLETSELNDSFDSDLKIIDELNELFKVTEEAACTDRAIDQNLTTDITNDQIIKAINESLNEITADDTASNDSTISNETTITNESSNNNETNGSSKNESTNELSNEPTAMQSSTFDVDLSNTTNDAAANGSIFNQLIGDDSFENQILKLNCSTKDSIVRILNQLTTYLATGKVISTDLKQMIVRRIDNLMAVLGALESSTTKKPGGSRSSEQTIELPNEIRVEIIEQLNANREFLNSTNSLTDQMKEDLINENTTLNIFLSNLTGHRESSDFNHKPNVINHAKGKVLLFA